MLLHKELLERLPRLVELVLLDVPPDAVPHLRRYVLRDDREQEVLLQNGGSYLLENRISVVLTIRGHNSIGCELGTFRPTKSTKSDTEY